MRKQGVYVGIKRWLGRTVGALLLGLLVIGGFRWVQVWVDLHRPERRAAWEQIQREGIRDYMIWEQIKRQGHDVMVPRFDPHTAKLWLATGLDPNGNDCAGIRKPPMAFGLAILKPLGLCKPYRSTPFIAVVFHGFSPEAREVAKVMIEAGADVNRVSPEGIVPLQSAVLFENEEMVKLLLAAGADPLLRPKYNYIGDFRSALETAESLSKSPRADRIGQMVRTAAEQRMNSSRESAK